MSKFFKLGYGFSFLLHYVAADTALMMIVVESRSSFLLRCITADTALMTCDLYSCCTAHTNQALKGRNNKAPGEARG